jgi:hypothetical protein
VGSSPTFSTTPRENKMNNVSIKSKVVTDYWKEFYTEDKICSLCGNRGVIDTSGVMSPIGINVGRKNFCICPNGQDLRNTYAKDSGDRKIMP